MGMTGRIELRAAEKREGSKLVAFGSFEHAGLWIDCKIIQGREALFVSLPSYQYKDSEGEMSWRNSVRPMDGTCWRALSDAILDHYNKMVAESVQPEKNGDDVDDDVPF